jgi:uncharacterized protein YdaU (DUF1376 family)
MHYYKFNIADWHLATSHLSLEEEAVYFKLINYYYDSEQCIPKETQSVIRRLRLGNHEETVGLILKEFFDFRDGFWHHNRCDEVIASYHKKADTNKKVGKLGGRPKKINDLEHNPQITQMVSENNPQITLTTNHKPITNNQYTSEFESFWKVYDKPSGKANAFKVWKSIKPDSTLLATIMQKATLQTKNVERKFRKDAERWLRDKRWEDEIAVKPYNDIF